MLFDLIAVLLKAFSILLSDVLKDILFQSISFCHN